MIATLETGKNDEIEDNMALSGAILKPNKEHRIPSEDDGQVTLVAVCWLNSYASNRFRALMQQGGFV